MMSHLSHQELDSEEDSGSNTSRELELDYETPPIGTPSSSIQFPVHGGSVPVSTGVSYASAGTKREGGERTRAKANRGERLQRGKYLGKKVRKVCSKSFIPYSKICSRSIPSF